MYPLVKRCFDILFSLLAIVVALPFMIPVILILLMTGEHYVFYFQKRIGYKNKPFQIIKFATMLKNSPNMGTGLITLRNDPRLLPLGKFLRITKLNELPQLLNILKGDMSFVGPRPLVDKTFNAYPENIRYHVYDSEPGITGIGSVVFRDEEGLITQSGMNPQEYYSTIIAPRKGALEIWYNEHQSFLIDVKILMATGWVILFPESKIVSVLFPDLPATAPFETKK